MKPSGYWRGTGKATPFPDSEKFSMMYYPKCKEGYHAWGCCNCKYDCPEGMKDLTSMCMKNTYQRGNPRKPGCADPTHEMDEITQMCYPRCSYGFTSGGPLCWNPCPEGTKTCGGIFCLDPNTESCGEEISKSITQSLDMIKKMAESSPQGTVFNAGSYVAGHQLPSCK